MASFESLPLRYRLAAAVYPWRRVAEPAPWTPFASRPLADARIAIVTSAALYRSGIDEPFREQRGGDTSYRLLPHDVPLASLVIGQTSDAFDPAPLQRDPNLAFPRDRLAELIAARVIGSAAARHVSFNGSITAPGRLVRDTAPAVAEVLRADAVDAVLFVPV